MTTLFWIIIISLFLLSFLGLIFPIIPSVLALWGGFLLFEFGIERHELTTSFWVIAAILTIVIFVADIVANQLFVKKYGGSKTGERVAAIGVIVGSFIMPPFGVILVPFVLVFLVEAIAKNDLRHASVVAFASVLAFLSSTFAKFLIQLFLVIYFILDVFI